ncbi:MAG: diacylglycerol kinase family protein [Acidobacteriota bacterium]
MPTTRGTLFLNPSSGAKLSPEEKSALSDAAKGAGFEVIEVKRGLDVATVIRDRMAAGRRMFVAAGGDGTINSVIQPLIHTEAILGVIPVGTFNHFAKDVGIPLDWRAALDVVVSGETRSVDAARINDHYFVNNVSMGLYPELVARREEKGRDYPRWKARLWAAYTTLRKFPHVTVVVETPHHQEVIRTHVLMLSNNTYDLSRMGVEAPRNTMSEGRLSVYWLPHISRLALMSFGAHYLAGRVRQAPGFRSFRTTQMKMQASHATLRFGVDGELMTMPLPIVVTIAPQGLAVRVPRGQLETRPIPS